MKHETDITDGVGDAQEAAVVPIEGAGREERFVRVRGEAEERRHRPDQRVRVASQDAQTSQSRSQPVL